MEFQNPTIDRISAEQISREEKERKAETYAETHKESAKKVYDAFYGLAYSHGRVVFGRRILGRRILRRRFGDRSRLRPPRLIGGRSKHILIPEMLIAEGFTKDKSQPVKITQSLDEKRMPWQTLELPGLSIRIGWSVAVNEADGEVIELTEADVVNLSQLADQLDSGVDWNPIDPAKKPLPNTEYPRMEPLIF